MKPLQPSRRLPVLAAGLRAVVLALLFATAAAAQVPTLQFPTAGPGAAPVAPPQGFPGAANTAPSLNFGVPPATTFGAPAPAYDPYGAAGTISRPIDFGNLFGTGQGSLFGGTGAQPYGQPAANPYGIPQPPVTATWPSTAPASNPYGANPYGAPPFGAPPGYGAQPGYGTTPANPFGPGSPYYTPNNGSSLYPNGWTGGQPQASYFGQGERVFQDVGFRYSWINGDSDPNDLDINDIEVHGSIALIPNFLNSTQPLYVTPGFILHLWNGPRAPNPAELPSKAYSAYVGLAWRTNPEAVLGGDVYFQTGIHSDFDTLVTDSIRFQGQGLGLLRVTPNMTAKFGVRYLDRAKIKLLPAVGVLWQPTPTVKLDIFFPQPKLSIYLSTIGAAQVWAYAAGEYGGGNWTVNEPYGVERVDINDIRVTGGIEWFGPRGLNGFIEGGYVFNREVVYVVQPGLSFDSPDTFILRAGLSY